METWVECWCICAPTVGPSDKSILRSSHEPDIESEEGTVTHLERFSGSPASIPGVQSQQRSFQGGFVFGSIGRRNLAWHLPEA